MNEEELAVRKAVEKEVFDLSAMFRETTLEFLYKNKVSPNAGVNLIMRSLAEIAIISGSNAEDFKELLLKMPTVYSCIESELREIVDRGMGE